MNRGLLAKIFHETAVPSLLFGLAAAFFAGLLAAVIPTFFSQSASQLLNLPFVQNMIRGLVGAELAGAMNPQTMMAIAWVHPSVYVIFWAQAIAFWTRVPAGEIERGTMDFLLSLPVSRRVVYVTETVGWLAAGGVMIVLAWIGSQLGARFVAPEFRASPLLLARITINLFCLNLLIASLTGFVSAWCDSRGRAVGASAAVVLALFFWNFLTQLWLPVRELAWLSPLHYYQPLLILRDHSWPLADGAALLVCAGLFWWAGLWVFSRRDVCTV